MTVVTGCTCTYTAAATRHRRGAQYSSRLDNTNTINPHHTRQPEAQAYPELQVQQPSCAVHPVVLHARLYAGKEKT